MTAVERTAGNESQRVDIAAADLEQEEPDTGDSPVIPAASTELLDTLTQARIDKDFARLRYMLLTPEFYSKFEESFPKEEKGRARLHFAIACASVVVSLGVDADAMATPIVVEYCYGQTNGVEHIEPREQVSAAVRALLCGPGGSDIKLLANAEGKVPELTFTYVGKTDDGNYEVGSKLVWGPLGGMVFETVLHERELDGAKVWIPVEHTCIGIM